MAVIGCQPGLEGTGPAPIIAPDDRARIVTLSDGERCVVQHANARARVLECPQRGRVEAPPVAAPALRVSDIPGVPNLPPIPQSAEEAECRAARMARNRARGAAERAALEAAGLPGNLFGLWRRSERIAGRLEAARGTGSERSDPCRPN